MEYFKMVALRAYDARAFIASNELAQTMNDAGVLGKPQIWLTEER